MACPGSYTVVIIPLQSSLKSLDALHFFLWLKRLKDLEQEKDCLWTGLQVLEKARIWYHQRLEDNREQQSGAGLYTGVLETQSRGCLIRSCVQRVNGSLGNLMCDPNVAGIPGPKQDLNSDSSLRWQNTLLIQEVNQKSQQISKLEQERNRLIQELQELQPN